MFAAYSFSTIVVMQIDCRHSYKYLSSASPQIPIQHSNFARLFFVPQQMSRKKNFHAPIGKTINYNNSACIVRNKFENETGINQPHVIFMSIIKYIVSVYSHIIYIYIVAVKWSIVWAHLSVHIYYVPRTTDIRITNSAISNTRAIKNC